MKGELLLEEYERLEQLKKEEEIDEEEEMEELIEVSNGDSKEDLAKKHIQDLMDRKKETEELVKELLSATPGSENLKKISHLKTKEVIKKWNELNDEWYEKNNTSKRAKKFFKKNGFYYSDSWSVDYSTCMFLLPRVALLRKNLHGYSGCFEQHDETWNEYSKRAEKHWKRILDYIIRWCYIMVTKSDYEWNDEEYQIIEIGKALFYKYFDTLWD
jgi:thymidylate synthase